MKANPNDGRIQMRVKPGLKKHAIEQAFQHRMSLTGYIAWCIEQGPVKKGRPRKEK